GVAQELDAARSRVQHDADPVAADQVPLDRGRTADPVTAGPEDVHPAPYPGVSRDTQGVAAGQQPGLVGADVVAGDDVPGRAIADRTIAVPDVHTVVPGRGDDVPLQVVRDAVGVRPDPVARRPIKDLDTDPGADHRAAVFAQADDVAGDDVEVR